MHATHVFPSKIIFGPELFFHANFVLTLNLCQLRDFIASFSLTKVSVSQKKLHETVHLDGRMYKVLY